MSTPLSAVSHQLPFLPFTPHRSIFPSQFTPPHYPSLGINVVSFTHRSHHPTFSKHVSRRTTEWICKADNQKSPPPPSDLSKHESSKPDPLQNWQVVGLALLGFGFLVGPLLDGIHSGVQLQIYKNGAINIGSFHTNIVVPPLLAVFYGVVGLSQLALDKWLAHKDGIPGPSLRRLILSFLSLIAILEASAEMYKAGVPYNIESYVLFALSELNWALFDGTWWGFALAVVVGIGCPLAEVPIMKLFNVWHYPRANIQIFGEGLVTWVLSCYFSYTPFLSNLSRWLSFQSQLPEGSKKDRD